METLFAELIGECSARSLASLCFGGTPITVEEKNVARFPLCVLFSLHLCMFPSLGPPVLEQLEAGGIFKSPEPKHRDS